MECHYLIQQQYAHSIFISQMQKWILVISKGSKDDPLRTFLRTQNIHMAGQVSGRLPITRPKQKWSS